MKTESSAFGTARLKRFGEWPIFLFGLPNSIKVSTVKAKVGSGVFTDYLPYVLSIEGAEFAIEQSGHVASLSALRIILARNSTTETFITTTLYAQAPVTIDMAFYPGNDYAAIDPADLVPVARMVIGQILRADQSAIEIELWNDERKLSRIPKNKLSSSSLVVPQENKLAILPLLIGDFTKATGDAGSNDEFYRCLSENYVPLLLADEIYRASQSYTPFTKTNIGKWILCENDVGNGTDPVINKVFEYFEELQRHALVGTVNDSGGSPTYADVATWLSDNPQSEPYVPSGVYVARVRKTSDRNLYRIGEVEGPTNELNDYTGGSSYIWKNACDADESNYAELRLGQNPVRTRLAISFSKRGNLSGSFPRYLFWYLEVKDAEKTAGGGTRILVRTALISKGGNFTGSTAIDIISSTTLPAVYLVGPVTTVDGGGPTSFSAIGWGFEDLIGRLEITFPGGGSAQGQFAKIGFFGAEIQWNDEQASFLKERRAGEVLEGEWSSESREFMGSGVQRRTKRYWYVNDILAASRKRIFADVTGPRSFAASPSNPDGLSFTHASFVVAALLCDVLGYTYSEVDGPGIKRWQLFAPDCSMSFLQQIEADSLEVLRNVCQQVNLLLFRSASGVWKVMPRNSYLTNSSPSYSAPVTAFGDTKNDYIVKNLEVSKVEPIYNKFTVRYKYDWAKRDFTAETTVDYSGTFANGRPMPPVEANFIRTSAAATFLANALRDYYGKAHRRVRFQTSAAASILELGDYITVEHPALPTENPLPKFQITAIDYGPNDLQIDALEVTG